MHASHRIPRRPLAAAFAAFVAVCALGVQPCAAEVSSHVTAGFDSFIDRFTILDADTLESTQDFYIGLGNAFQYRRGAAKALLGNFFRYGNQSIDEHVNAEGSIAPARSTTLDVRGNLHWKHYQGGSDYEFGNDYTQADAIAKMRRSFGEYVRMTLRSRIEAIDYREKTDFDYDYRYLDGGAQVEVGPDIGRMALLGITMGSRAASDTTALSFNRVLAEFEARLFSATGPSFHLSSMGDRRDYRDGARSSYWSVISFLDASFNTAERVAYSLRGESELITFDRPDETYFDTHFMRGSARIRVRVRSMSYLVFETRYARMLCGDFPEERYGEGSLVVGAEIMRSDKLWVNLSYEPGYRNYSLDENELYSDFYVHRLSAMGSMSLPAGLELNLFVTHEPERHSRLQDDFSATLVSINLTKRL